MKIVVCVKQVPDTQDIRWTENNTMIRDGVESILNPFDAYAIETALRLKESLNSASITILSMGPLQAIEVLKKGLSMGVDDALLLSDKKFAGADTVATSRTISAAIKKKLSEFDLIICGQFAVDGDTAQTGPSIAEFLDIPQLTYVKEITNASKNSITAVRELENGLQTVEMELPGLICMLKCDYEARLPKIRDVMRASRANIPVYGLEDLELTQEEVGIKGSPTFVSKAFRPPERGAGEIICCETPEKAVESLLEKLKNCKVIN